MKVGLIVSGFSSESADWCIPVLVDVVRELTRRAEVHIFALRYPYRRDRYYVHGAKVHAIGGGTARGVRRGALLAGACRSVVIEHHRGSFDVLHGVWADEPGIVAVSMGRLLQVRTVVSVMGGELVGFPDIAYGGKLTPANHVLAYVALRLADRVTAGSGHSLELVRKTLPPSRHAAGVRLPWGVDSSVFVNDLEPIDLAGCFRVLHVGSLTPIKDQATLLRAIACVRRAQPGVHLHIVGDGPLRSALESQAAALCLSDSVTFHGHIPRDQLTLYYRSADVLVVSSRHEAQSVVLLEAALCGVFTVGTAVGLVGDFAPHAAISVPVGDSAAMALALEKLVSTPARQALSAEACACVHAEYLASHTVDRLMALYDRAMEPAL